MLLSGAAARALTGAMERARQDGERKFSAEHLLRALLADPHARAVELLRAAGVAPGAVLERLAAPAAPTRRTVPVPRAPPTATTSTRCCAPPGTRCSAARRTGCRAGSGCWYPASPR